jgi:hypothetical protein
LGWAHHQDRWYVAPSTITLSHRDYFVAAPTPVDELAVYEDNVTHVVLRRGRITVTFHGSSNQPATRPKG